MIEISSPADIVELAAIGGARSYQQWQCLKLMREKGRTLVVRIDGEAMMLACFFPVPGEAGVVEATFSVTPSGRKRLKTLVKLIRLTVMGAPYRLIVTVCRTRAGAHLARLCGFAFQLNTADGEVWTYGGHDFNSVWRRQHPGGQTRDAGHAAQVDAGPAAAQPGADRHATG